MDWNNEKNVLKALIGLYYRQTPEEADAGVTVEDNGVGFNGVDAPFLTSVAQQILHQKRGISSKQYDYVKKMLQHYPRQIAEISEYFDRIELPPTAVIYDKQKKGQIDGILDYDPSSNSPLIFRPYVYPTSQIRDLQFTWTDSKVWVAQYSRERVRKVLDMFPKAEKSESLIAFELEKVFDMARMEESLKTETGSGSLFAYQIQSVSFMTQAGRALLGLAPGTGKSACAVTAANKLGGKALIVSPFTLTRMWKAEIKKWTGDDSEVQIWHQNLGVSSKWVITNYDSIRTLWVDYDLKVTVDPETGKKKKEKVNWRCVVDHDFDTLIIDESIMVKNRKADRTKSLEVLAATCKNVWCLSGNPTSKFYDDLWAQLHILDPRRFSSYWRFTREYCHVAKTDWGDKVVANQADATERLRKDLWDIYFARTQDQVLNLPPWIIDDVEISMYPDQYRLYLEMENTFRALLPDGDVVVAPIVLAQLVRLIQFASNPVLIGGDDHGAKWDSVEEILEYETLPAIIWTSFIATAQSMKEKLSKKFRVGALTGATQEMDRQPVVDAFQTGNLDIIIAHPGVGKFGHTLTAARTAIYLERNYNGDDYYQSLHRIRRIGTKESPHVVHLLAARPAPYDAPTVDHVIGKILAYRKDNSVAITTGEIREAFGFDRA